MNLNTILERMHPGAEIATDGGSNQTRSPLERYSLPIKFVLLEVGLVVAGFVFSALGGASTDRLDPINATGGLLWAFAVILAACGALVALIWAGFALLDKRNSPGSPN